MPELFEICDNYTVLRDGKYIESGRFEDIDEHRATELLVGRTITNSQRKKSNIQDETIIKVQNLSAPPYFYDINFEVKKGEVLAVTGLHGDGRGELSEALFGARKCTEGKVFLNRKELKLKNINNVIRQGVGMVPRNRKERSIIKDMSIRDNLSVAHFVKESKNKLINKKTELSRFYRSQKKTGIKAGSPEDIITSLSGGNQQKVIIARWLEINSDVYILDNPTQGIDVGAKFEVYKLIDLLASEGKSIIIFSAEFPEIYKVADRCLVLYKGKINADLTGEDMSEKNVMYYATGANMEGLKCM
ncbi:MAG: ATP-binding cassette domain-containing protein, partial [Clostridia bacterium]|nr:ATP-binding cassette domain-containing protein [Clostridia bacterium]